MKKLLILLFLILISFNSYGLSGKTICVETDSQVQIRNNIVYVPNKTETFTGKNLCKYENGKNKSKGKVEDGKRDGKWIEWFENGHKKYEGNYKNGNIVSRTEYQYHENGLKKFEGNYKKISNTDKLLKHGKLTLWYDDGLVKEEVNYKHNKLEGKGTSWHENGQKFAEGNYKDGKYDGKWTMWHENGQKFAEGNYKDSKSDGEWTWWNMKGQKVEEANYKDGDLVNKTIFKYSYFTGRIKSEKKYKYGKCNSGDCPD